MLQRFNRPNLLFLVAVRLPALSQTPVLLHLLSSACAQIHYEFMGVFGWICNISGKKKPNLPFPDEGMIQTLAGKKIALLHQECPASLQPTPEWQVDLMLRHTSWTDVTLRWRSWCKVGVLVIRSHNSALLRKLICLRRVCVAAGWSHRSEGRNA